MFNFDGAVFQLLYQFGIDFSQIDTSKLTAGDCFILAMVYIVAVVFVVVILRGLFYCLRELTGSCLK